MKIMNYCLALLLVAQAPAQAESKFEKFALGAVAGVGALAAGCLAWNGSYYNAESAINAARAQEKSERMLYSTLLGYTSHGFLSQEIARKHMASRTHGLRNQYALLWFVDNLNNSICTLKDKHAKVVSYEYDMQKNPGYYQHLVADRAHVAISVGGLLASLELLLKDIMQMSEYWQQEREYQLARERQQIDAFRARVNKARYEISGIASGFARELDQLNTMALAGDFASLVYSIVTSNYNAASHGSTLRSSYPALRYEERICKAIRKIEGIHGNLYSEHNLVATLSLYHADVAHAEYMSLMHDVNYQLLRLRDVRDRLPSTYFYIADVRAYEQACRDQAAYEREEAARDRERRAAERELEALQRELDARQREYQAERRAAEARERERIALQQEREAREARERAERAAAAAATVAVTVAVGPKEYFPLDL